MVKRSLTFLLLALLVVTCPLYAQSQAETPQTSTLPPWQYALGIAGLNTALLAVKQYAPRIPAWTAPLINVGLALGASYVGLPTSGASDLLINTAVMAGGATLLHNTVKNVYRGDQLGQPPGAPPIEKEG